MIIALWSTWLFVFDRFESVAEGDNYLILMLLSSITFAVESIILVAEEGQDKVITVE